MKTQTLKNKSTRKAIRVCATSIAAFFVSQTAHAGTQYATGTFTWDDLTTPAWGVTGGPYTNVWTGGDDAILEGTAGTITAAGATAHSITFNTTGYTLNGTVGLTGTAPTISVGTGFSETSGATYTGSTGLNVSGGGTFNSPVTGLTYTGGTTISGTGTQVSLTGVTTSVTTTALNDADVIVETGAQLKLNNGDLYFGTSATARTMTIRSGGSLGGQALTINAANSGSLHGIAVGVGATSDGNNILVTGAGSFFAGNGGANNFFELGRDSDSNTLTVEQGAKMEYVKGNGTCFFQLGTNAGSDNNTLTVQDGNSVIYASNMPFDIGKAGSGNGIVVNGGTIGGGQTAPYMRMQRLNIGTNGGDNNYANITGDGTARSAAIYITGTGNNSQLGIGALGTSTGNSVTISAGGLLVNDSTTSATGRLNGLGGVAGSNSNTATITGVGSVLDINHPNHFAVGAFATSSSVTPTSDSNTLTLNDGGAIVTTAGIVAANSTTGGTINLGQGGTSIASIKIGASFAEYQSAYGGSLPVTAGGTAASFTGSGTTTWINLYSNGTSLSINKGRIYTGASFVSGGTLIGSTGSGTGGSVSFDGPAYFDISSGISTSITRPITGIGSLTKEGAGTLTISGTTPAYTGNTTISAGTLSIASGLSSYLADSSSVTIATGAIFDLGFSGTDTIASLTLGATTYTSGVFDSSNSGGLITGTGSLTVVGVPEPGAAVSLLGGLGMLLGLRRRRA